MRYGNRTIRDYGKVQDCAGARIVAMFTPTAMGMAIGRGTLDVDGTREGGYLGLLWRVHR
jgi:hypothetical protein